MGANLQGAQLCQVNLRGANLSQANLQEANLTGADLTDAILTQVDWQRKSESNAKIAGTDREKTTLSRPSSAPSVNLVLYSPPEIFCF